MTDRSPAHGAPSTSGPADPGTVTIVAPRLFDGADWHTGMAVHMAAGRIVAISQATATTLPPDAHLLPPGTILAPGFIDLQINGGGGALLNDGPDAATVALMLAAHRRFGTTGFLPTLISSSAATLATLAHNAHEIARQPGVLGLHLEGPFLNPARKGVHDAAHLRTLDARDLASIATIAKSLPTLLTLAPECVPPGTIARLTALGVIVAIGHSDATGVQVRAALDEGATAVTHLYNAMSQMTPREPGVVGTAFDDPRPICGLICDGLHVAPANLRIAARLLGRDRLALVTDAMPSVGAPDGSGFLLDGRRITLSNGRLTAPDGTLAGAHLSMIDAVRNATLLAGIPLADALVMASTTPARLLGLDSARGRISPGFTADLVAFSPSFDVLHTWINGR